MEIKMSNDGQAGRRKKIPKGAHRGTSSGIGTESDGMFRNHGFRQTLPRKTILEVLAENTGFVSAEDLYMQVHQRLPGAGLATVYRTLQVLEDIGVVMRIETGEGRSRFSLTAPDERIRNTVLICTNCFRAFSPEAVCEDRTKKLRGLCKKAESIFEGSDGFTVSQTVLHLYGICRRCTNSSIGKSSTGASTDPGSGG
jgi:Fur family transcriptional regulator, ferric uptake regulator